MTTVYICQLCDEVTANPQYSDEGLVCEDCYEDMRNAVDMEE